jgi:DinB superfamily
MTTRLEHDLSLVMTDLDEVVARVECSARRADISSWSVAQHLHHTALVAAMIATAIRGLLRGRGEPGEPPEGHAAEILQSGEIPRGVGEAPDGLRPDDDPDGDEIRTAVEKARARWSALAGQETAMAACGLRVPHPYFGPLSPEEWVRFAAIHGRHHLDIVADMLDE